MAADPVRLLVSRATYGPTWAVLDEVTRLGTGPWLSNQLNPAAKVPDPQMDALLTRWPRLALKTWQVRDLATWDVMYDLLDAHTARAIWSRRQLLEVMVDFWSNHLNVTCPSDGYDSRHLYDRDAIRPNALGTFTGLLKAASKHPSMLAYLGNKDSTRQAPNENQARELLELHTVGVDAGYTETDVQHSAAILSGLCVEEEGGIYEYKPWRHTVGPVQVLGFSHPNPTAEGGEAVADAYFTYLATHPATATRLATTLAVRFVADAPPASLVTNLAQVYLAAGTAIGPVLTALFTSPEFAASTGMKTKRPFEDMVSAVRALGVQPAASGTDGIRRLMWVTGQIGQPPLGWHPPTGYPDVAGAWASPSGTLALWNVHTALANRWWVDQWVQPEVTGWVTPLPATYGALVDRFAGKLAMPAVSPATRTAVCGFFGKAVGDPVRPTDEAVTWRVNQVVNLLLNSAAFASR